jgi:hypothetical protein
LPRKNPDPERRGFPSGRTTRQEIFKRRRYIPHTFQAVWRGTDLYARPDDNGEILFYFWHWMPGPVETCACPVVSREYAVWFIREMCCEQHETIGAGHANLPEYLPVLYRSMKD